MNQEELRECLTKYINNDYDEDDLIYKINIIQTFEYCINNGSTNFGEKTIRKPFEEFINVFNNDPRYKMYKFKIEVFQNLCKFYWENPIEVYCLQRKKDNNIFSKENCVFLAFLLMKIYTKYVMQKK